MEFRISIIFLGLLLFFFFHSILIQPCWLRRWCGGNAVRSNGHVFLFFSIFLYVYFIYLFIWTHKFLLLFLLRATLTHRAYRRCMWVRYSTPEMDKSMVNLNPICRTIFPAAAWRIALKMLPWYHGSCVCVCLLSPLVSFWHGDASAARTFVHTLNQWNVRCVRKCSKRAGENPVWNLIEFARVRKCSERWWQCQRDRRKCQDGICFRFEINRRTIRATSNDLCGKRQRCKKIKRRRR